MGPRFPSFGHSVRYPSTIADPGLAFGYERTPWVLRLLVANVAIFLLTWVIGAAFIFEWFAFSPRYLLTRPWGAVTYMFLHGDIWHLLLNMLVLFFFGAPLERQWGSSEFLRYYLLCGLGGVAFSFFFAPASSIIGASAAVYGLMLAFAWHWPDAPIYIWGIFPVKARWLVGFFFVLTFVSAFGGAGGGVAHFAHLGGLVAGVAYLRYGEGWTSQIAGRWSRPTSDRVTVVSGPAARTEERKRKVRVRSPQSPRGEEELLDEVDRILDKISAQGMNSLTLAERRTLDEVSRQRRTH